MYHVSLPFNPTETHLDTKNIWTSFQCEQNIILLLTTRILKVSVKTQALHMAMI